MVFEMHQPIWFEFIILFRFIRPSWLCPLICHQHVDHPSCLHHHLSLAYQPLAVATPAVVFGSNAQVRVRL